MHMKVDLNDVMEAMAAVRNDENVWYDADRGCFGYEMDGDEQGDNVIMLPDRKELNDYGIMEDFIASLDQPDAREWLGNAIRGKGAFRRFRGACERFHLLDDWYDFEDRAHRRQAVQWCDSCGIAYEEYAESGEEEFDWNNEEQFRVPAEKPAEKITHAPRIAMVNSRGCGTLLPLAEAFHGIADPENDVLPDDRIAKMETFLQDGGVILAVSDSGRYLGYIRGYRNGQVMIADELYVKKDCRRRGWGTALCRALEEEGLPLEIRVPAGCGDAAGFLSAAGYGSVFYTAFRKG